MNTPDNEKRHELTEKEYHIAVFICSHVFEKTSPILYVCKDDDEFQFLCAGLHYGDERPRIVGLGHMVDSDKSILDILHIANGEEAERGSVAEEWTIRKMAE